MITNSKLVATFSSLGSNIMLREIKLTLVICWRNLHQETKCRHFDTIN